MLDLKGKTRTELYRLITETLLANGQGLENAIPPEQIATHVGVGPNVVKKLVFEMVRRPSPDHVVCVAHEGIFIARELEHLHQAAKIMRTNLNALRTSHQRCSNLIHNINRSATNGN